MAGYSKGLSPKNYVSSCSGTALHYVMQNNSVRDVSYLSPSSAIQGLQLLVLTLSCRRFTFEFKNYCFHMLNVVMINDLLAY